MSPQISMPVPFWQSSLARSLRRTTILASGRLFSSLLPLPGIWSALAQGNHIGVLKSTPKGRENETSAHRGLWAKSPHPDISVGPHWSQELGQFLETFREDTLKCRGPLRNSLAWSKAYMAYDI